MRCLARAVPVWMSRPVGRVLLMAAALAATLLAAALLATMVARPAAAREPIAVQETGAQETGGPSYTQHHWTAEDGLPVNSVREIAEGPQGYLWLATYDGLVRFDGVEFAEMSGDQSQGASAEQTDSNSGSPDDPDRRNPGSPSNVPIGDHLHWLGVAGILWGAWQIGRGA